MADEPTISYRDAADICAKPWPSEQEACEQTVMLKRAGWLVKWRNPPPEFGKGTGLRMAASVYHPETFDSPGDVTYLT